jgi:hypothetical protein
MADNITSYSGAIAITVSDTLKAQMGTHICSDALYFVGGSSGALAVVMDDGSSQTFTGLTGTTGQILPLRVRNVLKTGTVALTGIIALFK